MTVEERIRFEKLPSVRTHKKTDYVDSISHVSETQLQ